MNEYIRTGRDKNIVDPSPHQVYSRRKECENQQKEFRNKTGDKERVKFPDEDKAWSTSLDTMPLFTRGHMDSHIKNSGKNITGNPNHSIPTGLRKAKTFLEDEYLESIKCCHDQRYFYVRAKCCHSFRKNDPPHDLKLALCIISGEVESCFCSCVAGKVGYCNHSLALMFKLCKFSLNKCVSTEDLSSESDQQQKLACTSQLQQWHKKGGGGNIHPEPVMDMVINKTKLDEERARPGITCNLYEARMKLKYDRTAEENMKRELSKINPNMGFSQMANDIEKTSSIETKFGKCQVGSYLTYQVGFTESNFRASCNIDSIQRLVIPNDANELKYPRFPLRNLNGADMVVPANISQDERDVLSSLIVSEDNINKIEEQTRKQSDCEQWKDERRIRFTASKFHLISKRQRNHDTFADSLINPKDIKSRALSHGLKFESVALMQYHKVMFNRKTPIQVLPCGFVVSKEYPILGASPDAKVVDKGCTDHFGLAEVKCPYTKFHVTPLDACSDPAFCMEKTSETECSLKKSHPYYAQVQGQMAITGAKWCDFIVYTNVGIHIERIPFDLLYWTELRDQLYSYYFKNFIPFAAAEVCKSKAL